jgi:hypothetical protein
MIDFSEAHIAELNIHYVGNKHKEEGIKLSDRNVLNEIGDGDEVTLQKFFLKPFTSEELFAFTHSSDLSLNEIYVYAKKIFADRSQFQTLSKDICKHLYLNSDHPKIKSGEFYVALFKDCDINGQQVDALGIFKSEHKDKFINVEFNKTGLSKISFMEGIDPKHLDKGCLIFNTNADEGYDVAIVDNTNRSAEAQYWKEDFLCIKPKEDEYYHTANYMRMCKEFVTKELPKEFDVAKPDQIGLLNRSVEFFKQNDTMDTATFTEEVFEQPAIINTFDNFVKEYQRENDFSFTEDFEISTSAVKKQSRVFKSVLKLDKNFHVYIHGDRNLIERGVDEVTGKKFYKIFYDEEN